MIIAMIVYHLCLTLMLGGVSPLVQGVLSVISIISSIVACVSWEITKHRLRMLEDIVKGEGYDAN